MCFAIQDDSFLLPFAPRWLLVARAHWDALRLGDYRPSIIIEQPVSEAESNIFDKHRVDGLERIVSSGRAVSRAALKSYCVWSRLSGGE